jgi:hypothetical protein
MIKKVTKTLGIDARKAAHYATIFPEQKKHLQPKRMKAQADKLIFNIDGVYTYTRPLFANRDGEGEAFQSQIQTGQKSAHLLTKQIVRYYFEHMIENRQGLTVT